MPHFEMTPDDLTGQLTDAFGTLLESPKPNALKRPKHETDTASKGTSDQLPKMMQALATREPAPGSGGAGYLHPLPSTATSSILPCVQQCTSDWKREVEQQSANQSLRQKLITMITQTLLERTLKVAQSTPATEIWQEALRRQLITESGC